MKTQQEFDDLERAWREQLAGRSLVVEANADPELAARAFAVLGRSLRNHTEPRSRASLLDRYRAALTVGLCSAGSSGYTGGNFWPAVGRAFGYELSPEDQRELSDAFRNALSKFGLSRFTTPLKNVGEILMHAGVPIRSLASFARLLQKRDSITAGLDGRQFVAWARSLSQDLATSHGFDVPTWRFVVEGGEISEDYIDRALALLDLASDSILDVDVEGGLPQPVVTELRRLIESGELSARSTGRKRQREDDLYPRLTFHSAFGVRVKFPPLESIVESAIAWRVAAEGRTERVDVPAPWPGDPVEPHFLSISQPAKQVVVSVQPTDQTWVLELVDVEDPLLVFEEEAGSLIPARNTLPKSTVWLAFANQDAKGFEERIESDVPLTVISRTDSPYGWNGWTFAEVDLSGASKLRFIGSERWRYVSSVVRPALANVVPIENVATAEGKRVSSTRPSIMLPPRAAEALEGVTWLITVETLGGALVASASFESQALARLVDPWPSALQEIFGDFLISVRGPLGRGLRQRVAVAEGVVFSSPLSCRLMSESGSGLDTAEYSLEAAHDSKTRAIHRSLGPTELSDACFLEHGESRLDLVVTIPALTISLQGDPGARRRVAPIPINREELGATVLRVDVPNLECGDLVAISEGKFVQGIHSAPGTPSVQLFNLAQLTDTLAGTGTAELLVVVGGRRIPVGHVRPRRLANAVTLDPSGLLELQGASVTRNLSCAVYPRFAPWRGPYLLSFPEGSTLLEIPDHVRAEGEGTIVIRIEDPWVPEPWPQLPDDSGSNAFRISLGELNDTATGAERGFRTWMARKGDCPNSEESLTLALALYSVVGKVAPVGQQAVMLTELTASVRTNRELAVEAVLDIDLTAPELMRLFVESEIVTVPGESWASTPLLWTYSAGLGVLADSDQMITDERPLLLNSLATHVGASAIAIVEHGKDSLAAVGKFGEEIKVLNKWPQERVDEVWKVASPLPGRLLDEDPRASAAKELFDVRNRKTIRTLAASSHLLLSKIRGMLVTEVGPEAAAPVTARQSETGWADLPALSLGFALCARLAARGGADAIALFQVLRGYYAELADAAPMIAEQDLALAELWVTYWRKNDNA